MKCRDYIGKLAEDYHHYKSQSSWDPERALDSGDSFHARIASDLRDGEKRTCLMNTADKRVLLMFDEMYTEYEKVSLFGPDWKRKLRQ